MIKCMGWRQIQASFFIGCFTCVFFSLLCQQADWWGLIFSEISTSRLSCSFRLETKVSRYPASAQNLWIDGYRIYARLSVDIPPFVLWILAAWTTTDSKQPSTSTTMCRFLPFVFPSVNSTFFAGCCCFHTLGIDDCAAWTLASGIDPHLLYIGADTAPILTFPSK